MQIKDNLKLGLLLRAFSAFILKYFPFLCLNLKLLCFKLKFLLKIY